MHTKSREMGQFTQFFKSTILWLQSVWKEVYLTCNLAMDIKRKLKCCWHRNIIWNKAPPTHLHNGTGRQNFVLHVGVAGWAAHRGKEPHGVLCRNGLPCSGFSAHDDRLILLISDKHHRWRKWTTPPLWSQCRTLIRSTKVSRCLALRERWRLTTITILTDVNTKLFTFPFVYQNIWITVFNLFAKCNDFKVFRLFFSSFFVKIFKLLFKNFRLVFINIKIISIIVVNEF